MPSATLKPASINRSGRTSNRLRIKARAVQCEILQVSARNVTTCCPEYESLPRAAFTAELGGAGMTTSCQIASRVYAGHELEARGEGANDMETVVRAASRLP